ncbi:hypothetical protein LISE100100_11960 [Listeria seeligeri]
MDYFITNELPTAEEFVQLRVDTGLSFRSVEVSSLALLKSVYFVGLRAKEDNKLIGMGRLIGDGMDYLYRFRRCRIAGTSRQRAWKSNYGKNSSLYRN